MSYQNSLGSNTGSNICLLLRQICDMQGLSSTTIDTETKTALNNMQMLGSKHLPYLLQDSGTNYFHLYNRHIGHAYSVAKSLSYLTTKWDSSQAWQELKGVCDAAGTKGILWADPVGNTYFSSNRSYDENAESLDMFLQFYEVDKTGNLGALSYATGSLWSYLNNNFISGSFYTYTPGSQIIECEGATMPLVFAKMRALNGYTITNWSNVLTDIKARFLNNGWDSPQWTSGSDRHYAVVHAHTDNPQVRLSNTLTAWTMLHAFYPLLDATSQSRMRELLTGSDTKAWDGLRSSSGLLNQLTHLFRWTSTESPTESATSAGIVTWMLQGIVPDTGNLYIPIYEFYYEGMAGLNKYFKFDIVNNKIRIPVNPGIIYFAFSDADPIPYTFTDNAVYDVTFNSTWTTINSVEFVELLDPTLLYTQQMLVGRFDQPFSFIAGGMYSDKIFQFYAHRPQYDPAITIMLALKNNWSLNGDNLTGSSIKFSTGWYDEKFQNQITIIPMASKKEVLTTGRPTYYRCSDQYIITIWLRPHQDSNTSFGREKHYEYFMRQEIERILRNKARIDTAFGEDNFETYVTLGNWRRTVEIKQFRPAVIRNDISVNVNYFKIVTEPMV